LRYSRDSVMSETRTYFAVITTPESLADRKGGEPRTGASTSHHLNLLILKENGDGRFPTNCQRRHPK
jgi:hypothetical protein